MHCFMMKRKKDQTTKQGKNTSTGEHELPRSTQLGFGFRKKTRLKSAGLWGENLHAGI